MECEKSQIYGTQFRRPCYLATAAEFLEAKARRVPPKDTPFSHASLPEAEIFDSSKLSVHEEQEALVPNLGSHQFV